MLNKNQTKVVIGIYYVQRLGILEFDQIFVMWYVYYIQVS